MSVGLKQPDNLKSVQGVRASSAACNIKSNGAPDLTLIVMEEGSKCAATFTQNAFCAAPVTVAKTHLGKKMPRALIINSGNANAGTGVQGISDATQSCQWVSEAVACSQEEVLPFSTGVIGEYLPMAKIQQGINEAVSNLSSDSWLSVAKGIMTTDTIPKAISRQCTIGNDVVTITGVAKGSGMICPNMATLLAFITTDANIDQNFLQQALSKIVDKTFNAITVDGDTSTNDACVLVATGKASNKELNNETEESKLFEKELFEVCLFLAQAIIRDGEGATKFVTVNVQGAKNDEEAKSVALTVAHSPLVKTALYASDPNWGRILAAVGRANIENFILSDINIFLDDVCIVKNGERDVQYTEEQGQAVMNNDEIEINIELSRGNVESTIWTTDLSNEYIRINSEYRS